MDGMAHKAVPRTYPPKPLTHQQVKLLALVWTLTGAAGIFVCLRLYSKLSRRKKLWLDDLFLVLAELALLAAAIICVIVVGNGYGLHYYEIPMESGQKNLLLGCVLGTVTVVGAIWSKTSWALTMLRLTDGWYRCFVWFAIVSVNLFMGFTALLIWIGCTPVQKSWEPYIEGDCWATEVFVVWGIVSGGARSSTHTRLSCC